MSACDNQSRRRFLKAAAAGSSVVALGVGAYGVTRELRSSSSGVKRVLGRTGLEVPTISFGAGHCHSPGVIRKGIERGMNLVETSRPYLGGRSEGIIGTAIKGLARDKIILVTKSLNHPQGRAGLIRDVEQSLRELGTDYIDIWMLHGLQFANEIVEPVFQEVVDDLKAAGKIRFCGLSTHHLEVIVPAATREKFYDVLQVIYNRRSPPEHAKLLSQAHAAGLGIIGMKSLANQEAVHIGPALRYGAELDFLDTTLVSITTYDRIDEDLDALQRPFNTDDERLLASWERQTSKLLCRSCNGCSGECAGKHSIPDLMRCILYLERYQQEDFAHEQFQAASALGLPRDCISCPRCQVRCRFGIDIQERMHHVHKIFSTG